ncbi:protein-disulfide reductase DsbD family protein [Robiginitomaculum antarcticum]|uniref:protein-disulfide reductase DsbD family protein n=1 Tax=Robiginitomaculum antarcticum TaxID=437507 RepID=UPI0003736C32|nr:thioredoxin family protein [Robiginitomaculum antarcticum]
MSKLVLCWLIAMTVFTPVYAAETSGVEIDESRVTVVTDHDVIAPGQSFYMAVQWAMEPGWHVYWKNPGDSGESLQIDLDPRTAFMAGEIIWATPKAVATGPIINYGYEGRALFPVLITASEDSVPGETLTLSGSAYALVCAEICIPRTVPFSLSLRVGEPQIDNRWQNNIERTLKKVPPPSAAKASAYLDDGALFVDVADMELADGVIEDAYIFPDEPSFISPSDAQQITLGPQGLRARLVPGYKTENGVESEIPFILAFTQDGEYKGVHLTAKPGPPLDVGLAVIPSASTIAGGEISLLIAVLFALLGGVILNLMPCVFPVISIKILSFAKSGAMSAAQIRAKGWAYAGGVFATFAILVAILIVIKSTGQLIGWGFQFQNPAIPAVLALLMFMIGLSLLGVFDISGPWQNTGQDLTARRGLGGSFATGALAVVVATPCTAPFMAGAIGYALAAPMMSMIAVFAALALGFALPFLILCYVPKLLQSLPKPGPWMKTFQEILAFPMFATAIYLAWVVSQQTGANGAAKVLIAMLLAGFGIWLLRRTHIAFKALAILALIVAVALPFTLETDAAIGTLSADAGYEKLVWSPQKVAELRAEGRAVFVDFTAAWCVTCKVNERGALADKDVAAAFNATNTAFLVADWTNRDDVIAAELKLYGRAGVPLYLYFPPLAAGEAHDPAGAQILPQVLFSGKVIEILQGG